MNITTILNITTYVLVALVALILLAMLALSLRKPVITKLGVRNLPRRPAQTVLIIVGLTLSTIIIISSLSIGNSLSYSVRKQAVSAYGEVDQILSPPLLATLASLLQEEDSDLEGSSGMSRIQQALGGDLASIFSLLREGLPGIPEERYAVLRDRAKQEPLIDGVAPSILFPTIIRNVSSGQSEPLGFIFAVNDEYTQDFGLHTVEGRPVEIADLDTGVGNIFETAFTLFRNLAGQTEAGAVETEITPGALALAGIGAFLSQQGQDLGQADLSSETLQQFGQFMQTQGLEVDADNLPGANLLSTINLNTLRGDIDRVLGRFGLQLRQGEVYLSRVGAERLNARVGDVLEIHIGPLPIPYRVAGLVEEAGPLSALFPVVVMRLDEAQQLLFMPDRVNNVLVSNAGDALAGLQHTDQVSQRLQVLTLNDDAVERLVDRLRQPEVRAVLDQAVTEYRANFSAGRRPTAETTGMPEDFGGVAQLLEQPGPDTLQNLETLQAELDRPEPGENLRTALVDGGVVGLLRRLELESPARQAELEEVLNNLTSVSLITPLNKATIVFAAETASSAFIVVFAIFGIFSILAGVLLIFMIFVMLAAERRSELGTARALGMQRGQLVQMFVSEGLVYDLLAAALGVALGIAASYAMVDFIGRVFSDITGQVSGQSTLFRVEFYVAPRSMIIAYCLGVLLTFLVVTLASWQASSLNIVQAIRNLTDEEAPETNQPSWRRLALLLLAVLPVMGGLAIIAAGQGGNYAQVVATLILVGLALVLGRVLQSRTQMRAERRRRLVFTLIGLGLLVVWAIPWQAGGSGGLEALANPAAAAAWFVLSGPLIIIGAILAIVHNADAILWLVNRLFGGLNWLTPVLRMAIAYPLSARYRTGMAMAMFAIVITTVTVMAVVIEATQAAITPDSQANAGFEIQASPSLLSFFNPITDLKTAIAAQPDFPQDQVEAVAQFSRLGMEMQPPDSGWQTMDLTGVNEDYLDQAERYYAFQALAPGFASDAEVWQALRERDGVAIVTAEVVAPETEPVEMGLDPMQPRFNLAGLNVADMTLNVRAVGKDETTYPLQIIAVLEPGPTLAGPGIQVNERFLAQVNGEPVRPDRFYLKVTSGAEVREVARQLESALASSGLNTSVTSEAFASAQRVTRGILQLFQGFMALGLLVGIAALGVISSRTVVERRQQVGVVRAIGLQGNLVALSFLVEASFIALGGICLGVLTGVLLGQRMVLAFFPILTGGASYGLPWLQIGGIVLLAYLASLLTTLLPAYQASRIYPAEALRYE